MCAHVLVAEDDRRQAEILRVYLEREGHEVYVAHNGRAALTRLRTAPTDLAVLDVLMPQLDGWDVCRQARAESDLAILFLTARAGEEDLLHGLDLGADDYMTKPYSPRELVTRVRALLRRARSGAAGVEREVLQVGRLRIDTIARSATVDGRPVAFTPGEFDIVTRMARAPGRVFTRSQLQRRDRDDPGSDRAVDMHVANIRKKIEVAPRAPRQLLTVHGLGYRLAAGE